ncbi:MAG: hypothetical protein Q9M91_06340 [Candidatus Dojkabacteria bacterium]|nr:hypothetical protein [Candidatus Dojkabacteria bacterium]
MNQLGELLLDPWINDLKEFLENGDVNRIVHFHTYDVKAPYSAYKGLDTSTERTPFMIMNEYDTYPGIYHKNQKKLKGELLNIYDMGKLQTIFNNISDSIYNDTNMLNIDTAYKMLGSSLGTFCNSVDKGGF